MINDIFSIPDPDAVLNIGLDKTFIEGYYIIESRDDLRLM